MADLCPSSTHTAPAGGGRCPCGAVTVMPAGRTEPTSSGPTVAGWCPMGCGETLFLSPAGVVHCSNVDCPTPQAVADLLAVRETDHIVQLAGDTFTVRHPLRERLDDALMTCDLADYLTQLDPPLHNRGHRAGRFRSYRLGDPDTGSWVYVALP